MPERNRRTTTRHPPRLVIRFPDGGALFDPDWSTHIVSFNGVVTLELPDHKLFKFKPGDEVPPGLHFRPSKVSKAKARKQKWRPHFNWAYVPNFAKAKQVPV